MTFKSLIEQCNDEAVLATLLDVYPDQKNSIQGYSKLLKDLRAMKPAKREDEMMIELYRATDDFNEDEPVEYVGVHGYMPDEDIGYAIEFTPWNVWLAMPVHPETIVAFSEEEIVAHCIWEMTFCGFEEDYIQEKIKSIKEIAEDIKNNPS